MLDIVHIEDKERVYKNEYNNPIKILWESTFLKQVIEFTYNDNNELIEEKVTQIDKSTNVIHIVYCTYAGSVSKIVDIDNGVIEIMEFEEYEQG